MKKLFLLISILFIFNKAYTQDYTPMLEIGKIWNMYLSFDYPGGYYFNLEVTETVEINGLTYYHIEATHNGCDTFLREDRNEKKIYGIWEGEEYLHYDFSLEVGEYIWVFGDMWLITDIGFGDFYGMENLRYYVLDGYKKLIEGIGFENYGIADTFVDCYLYTPPYETIHLVNMNQPLSLEVITSDQISIYPNPVHDVLQIEDNNQLEIKNIQVYSTLGKLVLSSHFQKESKQVDLSGLNGGTYFVKIKTDMGCLTKKIIKITQ